MRHRTICLLYLTPIEGGKYKNPHCVVLSEEYDFFFVWAQTRIIYNKNNNYDIMTYSFELFSTHPPSQLLLTVRYNNNIPTQYYICHY